MKKFVSVICLTWLILSTTLFVSCMNTYRDYSYEGMDFYNDYSSIVPEDTVINISSKDEKLLKDYEYQDATFNYHARNVGSNQIAPGDFSLNILVLEYDESVYEQVKEYLIGRAEYSADSPQFSYNGHDFYEYICGWTDEKNIAYHIFNDETKSVIILAHSGIRISDWLYTYEEQEKPIKFFKKYYGEYYDFDTAQKVDD